jgi:ribonuclease HI
LGVRLRDRASKQLWHVVGAYFPAKGHAERSAICGAVDLSALDGHVVFLGDFNTCTSAGDSASEHARDDPSALDLLRLTEDAGLSDTWDLEASGMDPDDEEEPVAAPPQRAFTWVARSGLAASRIDRIFVSRSLAAEAPFTRPFASSDHLSVGTRVREAAGHDAVGVGGTPYRRRKINPTSIRSPQFRNAFRRVADEVWLRPLRVGEYHRDKLIEVLDRASDIGASTQRSLLTSRRKAIKRINGRIQEAAHKLQAAQGPLNRTRAAAELALARERSFRESEEQTELLLVRKRMTMFPLTCSSAQLVSRLLAAEAERASEMGGANLDLLARSLEERYKRTPVDEDALASVLLALSPFDVSPRACSGDGALPTAVSAVARLEEFAAVLRGLPAGKSPGPDGLPPEFGHLFSDTLAPFFLAAFNESVGLAPPDLLEDEALAILLYKGKGDRAELKSYRGIVLLGFLARVRSSILRDRLTPIVMRNMPPEQTGFCKGRLIDDAICRVDATVAAARAQRRRIAIVFSDVAQAFDSFQWEAMWRTARRRGFSEADVRLFQSDTECTRLRLISGDRSAEPFRRFSGVTQGGPASALLYVLLNTVFPEVSASRGYLGDGQLRSDWPQPALNSPDHATRLAAALRPARGIQHCDDRAWPACSAEQFERGMETERLLSRAGFGLLNPAKTFVALYGDATDPHFGPLPQELVDLHNRSPDFSLHLGITRPKNDSLLIPDVLAKVKAKVQAKCNQLQVNRLDDRTRTAVSNTFLMPCTLHVATPAHVDPRAFLELDKLCIGMANQGRHAANQFRKETLLTPPAYGGFGLIAPSHLIYARRCSTALDIACGKKPILEGLFATALPAAIESNSVAPLFVGWSQVAALLCVPVNLLSPLDPLTQIAPEPGSWLCWAKAKPKHPPTMLKDVTVQHLRVAAVKAEVLLSKRPPAEREQSWDAPDLPLRNGTLPNSLVLDPILRRVPKLAQTLYTTQRDKYAFGANIGHKRCPLCWLPLQKRSPAEPWADTLHWAHSCPSTASARDAMAHDFSTWGVSPALFSLSLQLDAPASPDSWVGLLASLAAIRALWSGVASHLFGKKPFPAPTVFNVTWRQLLCSSLNAICLPSPMHLRAPVPVPEFFSALATKAAPLLSRSQPGDRFVVRVDGGAKCSPATGNPCPTVCNVATIGGTVANLDRDGVFAAFGAYVGKASNNVAEFAAAAAAYHLVGSVRGVVVESVHDSELFVRCANGQASITASSALNVTFDIAMNELNRCRNGRTVFKHVLRNRNAGPDLLANVAYNHIGPEPWVHTEITVRHPDDSQKLFLFSYGGARDGWRDLDEWKTPNGIVFSSSTLPSGPARDDPLSIYGKPPSDLLFASAISKRALLAAEASSTDSARHKLTSRARRLFFNNGKWLGEHGQAVISLAPSSAALAAPVWAIPPDPEAAPDQEEDDDQDQAPHDSDDDAAESQRGNVQRAVPPVSAALADLFEDGSEDGEIRPVQRPTSDASNPAWCDSNSFPRRFCKASTAPPVPAPSPFSRPARKARRVPLAPASGSRASPATRRPSCARLRSPWPFEAYQRPPRRHAVSFAPASCSPNTFPLPDLHAPRPAADSGSRTDDSSSTKTCTSTSFDFPRTSGTYNKTFTYSSFSGFSLVSPLLLQYPP